jgi:hypothetical protein
MKRLRAWEWLLLLVGLLVFAAQAALASPLKSAAFDEEYHLAAGYAYLKTGDFRLSTSHPPLVDALGAVPLLFMDGVTLPTDHPSWAQSDYFIFSDVFLWQANDNPQPMLVNGRLRHHHPRHPPRRRPVCLGAADGRAGRRLDRPGVGRLRAESHRQRPSPDHRFRAGPVPDADDVALVGVAGTAVAP